MVSLNTYDLFLAGFHVDVMQEALQWSSSTDPTVTLFSYSDFCRLSKEKVL